MNTHMKEFAGGVLLLVLFAVSLFEANRFEEYASSISALTGLPGMVAYVLLAFVATVIAPLSAMPLLPLASSLWGPLLTALLSIVAWTLGSIVAFVLARSLARPFVVRFVDLAYAEKVTAGLMGEATFLRLVLLRMIVPVDVLSYAIGLLVPISLARYTLATAIGVTPFAFLFSYAHVLPTWLQVASIGGAFVGLLLLYLRTAARRSLSSASNTI